MPRAPDFDVYFGAVDDTAPFDWRDFPDDALDDDELLFESPASLVSILGFDPLEFVKGFDPNQARDAEGKWSEAGAGAIAISSADFALNKLDLNELKAGVESRMEAADEDSHEYEALGYINATISLDQKVELSQRRNFRARYVVHDGQVIAAGAMTFDRSAKEARIEFVGSTERGAGAVVMTALIRDAHEQKMSRIVAEVADVGVQRFNERHGFSVVAGGDDEHPYMQLDLKKFDPNQPRDDKGKWSTVSAYHGTSTVVLDSILEKGLTVVAGDRSFDLDDEDVGGLYNGERGQSVYVSRSEYMAKDYAEHAAAVRDGKPVLLEIKIPQDEWEHNYVPDEQDSERAYRTTKTIKPEWIVAVSIMESNQEWEPYPIGKAAGQTIFVVLDLKEWAEVEKFDTNQPRDERGRWSETGAGSAGAGGVPADLKDYEVPAGIRNATDLFLHNYDPSITADMVIDSVKGARAVVEQAEELYVNGEQTQDTFKGTDGKYVPERVEVHDAIIEDVFHEDAIAQARPGEGEQPVFTVLGGRGGSGKSWFTSEAGPAKKESLVLNADNFKEALPEYNGLNAGLLHEESSDLVARAHHIARGAGLNVTFDATMRATGTIDRMIDEYKAAGYRVEGYFMHTAPHISAVRATNRFLRTGRYVPVEYILSSTSNEKSFDAMSPKMDRWAVYDNNGARGTPIPTLVVSK